jgi:hypothetical protein
MGYATCHGLLTFVEVGCFNRYRNVYTESDYMFNDMLDITQRTDLWMGSIHRDGVSKHLLVKAKAR